jgi:hypothetical protein
MGSARTHERSTHTSACAFSCPPMAHLSSTPVARRLQHWYAGRQCLATRAVKHSCPCACRSAPVINATPRRLCRTANLQGSLYIKPTAAPLAPTKEDNNGRRTRPFIRKGKNDHEASGSRRQRSPPPPPPRATLARPRQVRRSTMPRCAQRPPRDKVYVRVRMARRR